MIPVDQWRWYGNAGHFICSHDCRFHICTEIGPFLVSTVGELLFDAPVREIIAEHRGIKLIGKGDARRDDYIKKVGYEAVGYGRKYETMVFRTTGERCETKDCGCGLPTIIPSELAMQGANTAGDATRNHIRLCHTWAEREHVE